MERKRKKTLNTTIRETRATQCQEIVTAFFTNTSIRGFNRIVRSDSLFLQLLWICFVTFTIIFLVVSIFKVVVDYRQYSVNIQTYIQLDNGTKFPAVTFCNHQPFSEQAYKLWDKGEEVSPTEYNARIRAAALRQFILLQNRSVPISNDALFDPVVISMFSDEISKYYQNLSLESTYRIGHNTSIIKNCIWIYHQSRMAFDHQCEDKMLVVKRFSHPKYFNCFTIEPAPNFSYDISQLGLIIWLGPNESQHKKHTQGFLLDLFAQAYGLRVVIHEPETYPQIESKGLQIEPGRLNELSYKAKLNVKVNTEKKACTNQYQHIVYKDLQNVYHYDIDLCFNYALQALIIAKCQCIYAYYPRFKNPNSSLPYCAYMNPSNMPAYKLRVECIKNIFSKQAQIKQKLRLNQTCIHRCVNLDYDITTSVTKWRTTDWQFYWLKYMSQTYSQFYKLFIPYRLNTTAPIPDDVQGQLKNISESIQLFLTKKNLTNSVPDNEKLVFNDRYTFLLIKRQSNDTFIEEERLVLTFNALVSRVGGLCSLYIGLTFAFFIELVDFLYTILFLRRNSSKFGLRKRPENCTLTANEIMDKTPVSSNKTFIKCNKSNKTSNRSGGEGRYNPMDDVSDQQIFWNLSSKHKSRNIISSNNIDNSNNNPNVEGIAIETINDETESEINDRFRYGDLPNPWIPKEKPDSWNL